MWQTDRHAISFFLFCWSSKPLEHWTDAFTTWATRVVQSHHHIFSLFRPIWIVLTWGRLWKSYVLSQGSDVAYIKVTGQGQYTFLIDKQTGRQTGRHKYSAVLELTGLISMDCLQTVSYKRKYVHKLLVNRLLKPAQEKVWLSELTIPQWP